MENKQRKMRNEGMTLPCGCPGSQSRNIQRQEAPVVETPQTQQTSRLSQWPVQIKLVPVNAPYFDGTRLLIAADCTAYAYAAFHERFIKGHITLVGCPKLDSMDYSEKLTEIIRENDIGSVTVVPFPVSWTVKMKKKQKETQDILSYHTQAAGCSDKARAKASGGRQPIEECGRTGL